MSCATKATFGNMIIVERGKIISELKPYDLFINLKKSVIYSFQYLCEILFTVGH